MICCDLKSQCRYFEKEHRCSYEMLKRLKERYCEGDYTGCARYITARTVGRQSVPEDLSPEEVDRLRDLFSDLERRSTEAAS